MKVRASDYRFSWSLRRRRLWNGCRRRYFLTYYAPRGGHDPAAEPALRRLHLAKSLFSRDGYCNYLLRTTMRELFYRRNEEEDTSTAPDLRSRVLHAFARDFNRMLLGFWQEDHRVPMLRELLQSGAAPEAVRREVETQLKESAVALEQGGWGEFQRFPAECRRPLPSPLEVPLGELSCWCSPCFALTSGRELWLVESESDTSPEAALLHKFYALNTCRIPPEQVRSFRLDCRDGSVTEFGGDLNISAALAGIRADAGAMQQAIRPDGTVAEEDFPADTTRCANCPFPGCCAAFLSATH